MLPEAIFPPRRYFGLVASCYLHSHCNLGVVLPRRGGNVCGEEPPLLSLNFWRTHPCQHHGSQGPWRLWEVKAEHVLSSPPLQKACGQTVPLSLFVLTEQMETCVSLFSPHSSQYFFFQSSLMLA